MTNFTIFSVLGLFPILITIRWFFFLIERPTLKTLKINAEDKVGIIYVSVTLGLAIYTDQFTQYLLMSAASLLFATVSMCALSYGGGDKGIRKGRKIAILIFLVTLIIHVVTHSI